MRKIIASRCIDGNAERVYAATAALHQIHSGVLNAVFQGVDIISAVKFPDVNKFTMLAYRAEKNKSRTCPPVSPALRKAKQLQGLTPGIVKLFFQDGCVCLHDAIDGEGGRKVKYDFPWF